MSTRKVPRRRSCFPIEEEEEEEREHQRYCHQLHGRQPMRERTCRFEISSLDLYSR